MRWLVLVYSLLCFLLFLVSFLFLNSFFYEGMPPGTYLESVDVSSLNFKEFTSLADRSLNRAKSYVFKSKIENKIVYLEQGRNLHFTMNKKDILQQYRIAKKRVTFFQRLKSFVYLDYQKYEIPLKISVDRKKSTMVLNRYFSSFEGETVRLKEKELIRSQKKVDYDSLFSGIEKIIQTQQPDLYSLDVHFVQTSVGETIQQDKLFLISESSTAISSAIRGYDLITDILNRESSILLNPGDEFSFKDFVSKSSLDFKFYEDRVKTFDDYIYDDYYGLEVLASLILQAVTASNLQVLENHYQPYILPGATVTRNTFSSKLSKSNDLRIYQNKRIPIRVVFQLIEKSISVGVYTFESPKETYSLKLDFYKSIYPTIDSQVDTFLGEQEIKILRKPLNGLLSQFKRQTFRQGVQVSYRRLKKRKISARDGLILVGQGVQNIYDPRILYTLGLQELNQAEN